MSATPVLIPAPKPPDSPSPRVHVRGFADVSNACPHPQLSAGVRFDPFYDGLWEAGANATWVSKQAADRQAASGLATIPQHLSMPADDAWDRVFGHLPKQLRMLGALTMWQTLSAEQLAAITGVPAIATGRSADMGALFTLGLVDVGHVNMVMTATGKAARGTTLYRPSATDVFERKLTPLLTYPEWVAVTAGVPLGPASRYDRHNLLATELALRVSEYYEIGTVLGEKLSSADMLTGAGIGYPPVVRTTRAADATLIRTDGARIAVELTASTGERFEAKVRKWAADLSRIRMNDSGLVILFVIAQRPDRKSRAGDLRTKVLQTVARACAAYPGVSFDRTAARMLVADWQDWFPAPGMVSDSFLSLDAIRPTGDTGALWEPASALDIFDVPFQATNREPALAILHNANGLGGIPHWLRTGPGPELWRIPIRKAGFKHIPVAAPASPDSSVGLDLGAAKGVAGKARAPQRLGAPLGGS